MSWGVRGNENSSVSETRSDEFERWIRRKSQWIFYDKTSLFQPNESKMLNRRIKWLVHFARERNSFVFDFRVEASMEIKRL
jgi:hypothetical protein